MNIGAAFADHRALRIQQARERFMHCHLQSRPRSMRYWEDFAVGQTIDLGTHEFTSDSMIAFAREYDPQPMHVDPARAADSVYGGLIASGWQTAAVYMRLLVDALLVSTESL